MGLNKFGWCCVSLLLASVSLKAQFVKSEEVLLQKATHQDFSNQLFDTATSKIMIRNIIISGNNRTKSYMLVRELAVFEGEAYTNEDLHLRLRTTKEQLMNTSLFISVETDTLILSPDEIDVLINVKERWYLFPLPYFKVIDRDWNVWVNEHKASINRANIGAKISHYNLTGRNDKINLFLIGGYTQQLSFGYNLPYFDKKLQQGFNLGFSFARNREVNYKTDSNKQQFKQLPDFARQAIRAELGYSYRRGSRLRSGIRMSYNQEKIDSSIIALNPNYFGNGKANASYFDVSLQFQYFNVDFIPFPLRGWYIDVFAFNRFSKDLAQTSIGFKGLAAWSFLPKTYITIQGAGTVSLPSNQPFFNTKLLGYGSYYMQGLEYYVVDGTAGGMLRTTLRNEIWSFTVRNLFKAKNYNAIPFRLFLKTYGNAGYSYNRNPGTNFMNNRFLYTGGFGLDIMTIYDVVLKLEYSYNQFGQSGFFVHTATDF